jgi:hypothetical protein
MNRRTLLAPIVALAAAVSLVAAGDTPIPPPSKVGGKFEVSCGLSHIAQVDPIVSPGQPKSAHLHVFFGNETTDQNSVPSSLVGGPTTCRLADDSAAYWLPAAYRTDTMQAVLPVFIRAYYYGTPGVTETHFPAGLEMLAGNHDATQPSEAEHIVFSCANSRDTTPIRDYPYDCRTPPGVPASGGVVAIVRFPYCWDGTGTAPTDVTYPDPTGDGSCPVYTLPQLQIFERFGTRHHPRFQRGDLLTFSSGPWWTLHGDFMNGWNQPKLNGLVDGCLNPARDCGFLTDAMPGPGGP